MFQLLIFGFILLLVIIRQCKMDTKIDKLEIALEDVKAVVSVQKAHQKAMKKVLKRIKEINK